MIATNSMIEINNLTFCKKKLTKNIGQFCDISYAILDQECEKYQCYFLEYSSPNSFPITLQKNAQCIVLRNNKFIISKKINYLKPIYCIVPSFDLFERILKLRYSLQYSVKMSQKKYYNIIHYFIALLLQKINFTNKYINH
jgi:hypothetical protein